MSEQVFGSGVGHENSNDQIRARLDAVRHGAGGLRGDTDGRGRGADDYQGLVGQPLAAVTLPAELDARIIGPDTAVTMDHRPERLNIALSGSGIIERVYCG